jgi:hypothetical protein
MNTTIDTIASLDFSDRRRKGNSTKQIDFAINVLFKGYEVKVLDHYENGTNRKANEDLFERILKRLSAEHRLDLLVKERKIKINQPHLTIKLEVGQ